MDIDGTLVDTNYQHTLAWGRAFAAHGVQVALWRLHRHNGMGGDQLVGAVAGDKVEDELGDAIRRSEGGYYGELIEEVRPLPGARDLLAGLRQRGMRIVLASSAKERDRDRYLDLLDARGLIDGCTSDADVDRTKPQPDLVSVAMRKLPSCHEFVMIGDATWDAIAAARVGVPTIGLLSRRVRSGRTARRWLPVRLRRRRGPGGQTRTRASLRTPTPRVTCEGVMD